MANNTILIAKHLWNDGNACKEALELAKSKNLNIQWLVEYNDRTEAPEIYPIVNRYKIPAAVYIDDCILHFTDWESVETICEKIERKSAFKKILVDFDGVLHKYDLGWQNGSIYGLPIVGTHKGLDYLTRKFLKVDVFTSRLVTRELINWINMWMFKFNYIGNEYIKSDLWIDDRGMMFWDWDDDIIEEAESCLANQ